MLRRPLEPGEYGIVIAAAAFSAIPLIIVFFIFQRQIVQGIANTGLKG